MKRSGLQQDPPTRGPLGVVAEPILALATLAALERAGRPVPARWPRGVAAACALLGDVAGGGGAAAAVQDLLLRPLGWREGVAWGDGPAACATPGALSRVMGAWLRLSIGVDDPDLALPSAAFVRRAVAVVSELRPPAGPGAAPEWWGPGWVRNVGGVLAPSASPIAFGRIDPVAGAAAVCDPRTATIAVIVGRPGEGPPSLRAAADRRLRQHR